ncbi:hypothetical protein BV898_02357 [Hypsibius exemplaris]|uniref:Receptor ligand binding region domain-containing protein n=1 Tax=Hypsibius exemplaris TaxID=2072580 RepID=A0A1W0X8G3_HYPEX|nr:hypothetical protein BV898_02357 [Hypsibius exemplaris]
MKLHIIQMILGDGPSALGFNTMAPAYDVALKTASKKYPNIFGNVSVTRVFIPGVFSTCDFSTGEIIPLLYRLLPDIRRKEFPVILSPDCITEVMVMADFAREVKIPLIASTATDPGAATGRYPTLLTWAAAPFRNIVDAVVQLCRRFSWTEFNLYCDDSAEQSPMPEVLCALILAVMRTNAVAVSVISRHFDSSSTVGGGTLRPALSAGKKHSVINVFASAPSAYPSVLADASALSMATGEYVFVLLPSSPNEQHRYIDWFNITNPAVTSMFPFAFALDFLRINWLAVSNEVAEMRSISFDKYNWTIRKDRDRNVQRLAAYESALMMAEVVKESWSGLSNMTAESFVRAFYGKRFQLPSGVVKISPTGLRVCNMEIKQFRVKNRSLEVVLLFEQEPARLTPINGSAILWQGPSFPPPSRPACRDVSGSYCSQTTDNTYTVLIIGMSAFACLVGFAVAARFIFRMRRRVIADKNWWILQGYLGLPRRQRAMSCRDLLGRVNPRAHKSLFTLGQNDSLSAPSDFLDSTITPRRVLNSSIFFWNNTPSSE